MKKMFFLIQMICYYLLAVGQGVDFQNLTYNEALAKAKINEKMVLVDCYTSWCGPCKQMVAKEFPRKEMGDYINPKFVSIKIDMEKGEGIELRKRFDVNSYPTFLFLSSEGEILYRMVGYREANQFISELKKGISGGGRLEILTRRYKQGERTADFMNEYLWVLGENSMNTLQDQILIEFLKGKEEILLTDSVLCSIFRRYIKSPKNEVFLYVYDHKNVFIQKYGKSFGRFLESCWEEYPNSFLRREGKQVVGIEEEKMKAYISLMKKHKVSGREFVETKYGLIAATTNENWKKTLKWSKKYVDFERVEHKILINACRGMEEGLRGKIERQELFKVIEKHIDVLTEEAKKDTRRTYEVNGEKMSPTEFYKMLFIELRDKL